MKHATPEQPLHILVAEEQPIVREGILVLLARIKSLHIHPVGVQSVALLKNMLGSGRVDLLLVSPHFGGAFNFQTFRDKHPDVPCLPIVSDLRALEAARSLPHYITLGDTGEVIAACIEQICREQAIEVPVSEELLSAREKEVLVALAQGLSSKEIADKFFLSPYTVMTHRRNISRKLGIHSVGGLTIYALANKLIELN